MSDIEQTNKQPSYYSISPANVRYDNRLNDSERVIFAEITAFGDEYGYCTASDEYFASLYGYNELTILNRINHLRKLGYLKITYKYKDNVLQRQIAPVLYEGEGGSYE